MKTRSGYLRAPWEFELRKVDLPDKPPAQEIILKMEACGICGTDLSAAETALAWEPFGHEVAGVIEQVGEGVSHLTVGQKVVLETSSFCGHCELCRNGRVDLCNKAPGFWGRSAMGFAERMVVPAGCVVPYTDLSPEVASLAEPAAVAWDMVKTADIAFGDRVALIGPGPIALMAIPLLRNCGAREIVCFGRSHSRRRLEVAQALGAKAHVLDQPLGEQSDLQRQFERVLVTAPVDALPAALGLLSYGGILTYIGIGTGTGVVSFDANDFHFRKLQMRASFASPALYFPLALEALRSGLIPGELIISHRFPLQDLAAAMHFCRDDKKQAVKVVLTTN